MLQTIILNNHYQYRNREKKKTAVPNISSSHVTKNIFVTPIYHKLDYFSLLHFSLIVLHIQNNCVGLGYSLRILTCEGVNKTNYSRLVNVCIYFNSFTNNAG